MQIVARDMLHHEELAVGLDKMIDHLRRALEQRRFPTADQRPGKLHPFRPCRSTARQDSGFGPSNFVLAVS
jgi:hypothetical protein